MIPSDRDYDYDGLLGRCPRLTPEGYPRCCHPAAVHDINGICSECDIESLGTFRCAEPETDEDPIWRYADREIVVERYGERPICGRLASVQSGIVMLQAIESPAVFAQNGGAFPREQVRRILWLRDEWPNPRFKAPVASPWP